MPLADCNRSTDEARLNHREFVIFTHGLCSVEMDINQTLIHLLHKTILTRLSMMQLINDYRTLKLCSGVQSDNSIFLSPVYVSAVAKVEQISIFIFKIG